MARAPGAHKLVALAASLLLLAADERADVRVDECKTTAGAWMGTQRWRESSRCITTRGSDSEGEADSSVNCVDRSCVGEREG